MSQFKVGDKVVCINNTNAEDTLVKAGVYTVTREADSDGYLHLNDKFDWQSWRFAHVDSPSSRRRVIIDGTEYVACGIPGRGMCFVPGTQPFFIECHGKIVLHRKNKIYCIVKALDDYTYQIIPLDTSWYSRTYEATDFLPDDYTVVAENISDAVRKGLLT